MNSSLPNLGSTVRVFIDTEFTDFINTDLISIGLAADNGEEYYGENSEFIKSWANPWVQSNIYPLLTPNTHGMGRSELSARVWCWIDELPCTSVIITIDYQTDYDLLLDLFGEKHPKIIGVQNIFENIFKSIDEQIISMGGSSTDYDNRSRKARAMFDLHQMDYFFRTKEDRHHALSDAKANREAYMKLVDDFGIVR